MSPISMVAVCSVLLVGFLYVNGKTISCSLKYTFLRKSGTLGGVPCGGTTPQLPVILNFVSTTLVTSACFGKTSVVSRVIFVRV